ncbi:Eco57I restriction-modification methylase domain-containing protein [Sphingobium cloacae]|uniref:site-specific DNA-methyltransferase (adenine-specific) n=1 Tax=Sphingobium cloacae TaxID=120107 RepID=A0A1E1F4M2_9SPHN|nr:N-6 DNA methylase [Sphingobium cloacae]BAV65457.1 type II DNA modification enzyme [Sphingobium cloacae]
MSRPTKRASDTGFAALTIEGGLIAPNQVQAIASAAPDQKTAADYGCPKGTGLRDEITRYFRIAQAHWQGYARLEQPTMQQTAEFARNLLEQAFGFELTGPHHHMREDRRFTIAWEAKGGRVPVVIAPPAPADKGKAGDGFARALPEFGDGADGRIARRSPTVLLQDWLNANPDFLWGLVFAGDRVRLMRDNASLTRPAWIEADLGAVFRDEMFADFAALWLLIHASRFGAEGAAASDCALERWREAGMRAGTSARERLRVNVEEALMALGQGILDANPAIRERLDTNQLTMPHLFEQLLRVVYRLIFLGVAEDRDLLHPPATPKAVRDLYSNNYGFAWARDRSTRRNAHDHHHDAWEGVKVTFRALERGEKLLGLPALGGLFDRSLTPDLDAAQIPNRALLAAAFKLGWLIEDGRRVRINWRDMATEELGSVYEGLLELVPTRKDDGRTFEFAGGAEARGNARKVSGSYYTPDSLVQCLLDSALDPVLERAEAEGGADAILELNVIDPACGSGHFLLGAARRMATRVAQLRNPDAPDYNAAMRDVVRNCIHGVDRNPMAIELAKVALWIESVEPGKPLGFLDANIQCGDSLLGVFDLKALDEGIPDDAYKPLTGDDKDTAKYFAKRNKDEKKGQGTLDFIGGGGTLPPARLAATMDDLRHLPEDSVAQIAEKRRRFAAWEADPKRYATKVACDLYIAGFLLPKKGGVPANANSVTVPTTSHLRTRLGGGQIYGPLEAAAVEAAGYARAFHWPLAFPEVMIGKGGFDVVLGNPPFANAIENELSNARDFEAIKFRTSGVKGAADLSARFLSLVSDVARPAGSSGLVLPRIILNSPTTEELRKSLNSRLRPSMIYCPPERDLFFGATIDIALLTLRNDGGVKVSRSNIGDIQWKTSSDFSNNWWSIVSSVWADRKIVAATGERLGDHFDVAGSMTTADAYDIREAIIDDEFGAGQRLITTGLIDPRACFWGRDECRYLKKSYKFPRLLESDLLPNSINKRVRNSKRPKILIAGLSPILEAYLDEYGTDIGAVATFSVFDESNNISRLQFLLDYLLSDLVLDKMKDELGGNALGGGAMTMKKGFLADLDLPEAVLMRR